MDDRQPAGPGRQLTGALSAGPRYNFTVTFRELALILVVVAAGVTLLWWETGRDRALLSAAAIMLGIFAVAGAFAVIVT